MAIPVKEKGSGNFLSFLLSTIFTAIVIAIIYYISQDQYFQTEIASLNEIGVFEFILLALAAFRLTRLFVYDSVAQFVRDLWLDKKEEKHDGKIYIHRTKPQSGIRRLLADLMSCPWCMGVWLSLFTVTVYLYLPATWFLWLLLAVAGTSSLIQLTINKIGWQAEEAKLRVQELEK